MSQIQRVTMPLAAKARIVLGLDRRTARAGSDASGDRPNGQQHGSECHQRGKHVRHAGSLRAGTASSRAQTCSGVALTALTAMTGLAMLVAPGAAAQDADQALAERYAPIVVVRDQAKPCGEGEPYLPVSVEAILGQASVTLNGPAGERIPAPTDADLAGKGDGWYLDFPGNPLDPKCDYEQWFGTLRANAQPTTYARIATDPDHPGQLALQYWFFWLFNDWNDRHEGDWEMIQLLFDAPDAVTALATGPQSVAFAQHEGSETADWTAAKVVRIDDHVVVYPGQGSHAAYYPQSLWFGKSAAAGFGCDDTQALGRRINPDVILMPEDGSGGFGWLDFTGRWGQRAPSFNNGPTGPNAKEQWTHPITWQQVDGRSDAVPLPIVSGPALDSFCSITRNASLLFIAVLDQPWLVAIVGLVAIVLLVLLIRGTRWRHGQDRQIDRERRAGQVFTASILVLARNLRAFWPYVLLTGLTNAAAIGLQRLVLEQRPSGDITDLLGLTGSPVRLAIAAVIGFAVAPVVSVFLAGTTRVVEQRARGQQGRPWSAMWTSVRHPSAAVVQLLAYVLVTVLASSLVLLPVAIWLISLWAVAVPAAAIEARRPLSALRRSQQLTKGRRWRAVFLSCLFIWVGVTLPGLIGGITLLLTGWPFWIANLVSIAASAILLPFSAIGLSLQYYDFRAEERRDRITEPAVVA